MKTTIPLQPHCVSSQPQSTRPSHHHDARGTLPRFDLEHDECHRQDGKEEAEDNHANKHNLQKTELQAKVQVRQMCEQILDNEEQER